MKAIILFFVLCSGCFAQNMAEINRTIANLPANEIARPRSIGYQPVIVWLPEGTTMGVSEVVSADRRYVHIGFGSLMFSGISRVDSFNFSSGKNVKIK